MKTAVIGYPESLNLGDEIQSIAVERLLGNTELRINREGLHKFKKNTPEEVKLICNGWFMTQPDHWPPSNDITPLFISMHISKASKSDTKMFSPEGIAYFKKYQPIGCRDNGTKALFLKHGIEAYYSGCMTLTLEKPEHILKNNKILLVDPFRTNYDEDYREHCLRSMIPERYRKDVEYIEQKSAPGFTEDQRFKLAENLLNEYAAAKLVITSRIHCALPCIAMGTPVYFINAGYHSMTEGLHDRFDGILNLLELIKEDTFPYSSSSLLDRFARKLGLYKNTKSINLNVNWDKPKQSIKDISDIKNGLTKRVKEFLK